MAESTFERVGSARSSFFDFCMLLVVQLSHSIPFVGATRENFVDKSEQRHCIRLIEALGSGGTATFRLGLSVPGPCSLHHVLHNDHVHPSLHLRLELSSLSPRNVQCCHLIQSSSFASVPTCLRSQSLQWLPGVLSVWWSSWTQARWFASGWLSWLGVLSHHKTTKLRAA